MKDIDRIKSLPIVSLVCDYTRPGSDFFQSLLDGHPEIIQLTGNVSHRIGDFYFGNDGLNAADLVEKFAFTDPFCSLFDSRFNRRERWNRLGENKNKHFSVPVDAFLECIKKIESDKFNSFYNFFIAVHLAYALAQGEKLENKKIIFFHMHRMDLHEAQYSSFPAMKFVCMTRDLRDGLYSAVNNIPEHYSYKYSLYSFNDVFKQYDYTHNKMQNHAGSFYVKLESLHSNPQLVMKNVCVNIGVSYLDEVVLKSTYHGLLWWGDEWSKERNGFSKNGMFSPNCWHEWLSTKDIRVIDYAYQDVLKGLGYEVNEKQETTQWSCFVFLPLSVEWSMLKEVKWGRWVIFKLRRESAFLINRIKNFAFRKKIEICLPYF